MRLQLDIIRINKIQFADRTAIADNILHINRQELQELLTEDKRLSQVEIFLAHPGENSRIVNVTDVVEPRAKTSGSGSNFPGALGKHATVGDGNTCVLRGASVILSEFRRQEDPPMEPGMPSHGGIIDMSGIGAQLSIYGSTNNIVLVPRPASGVSLNDYRLSLKLAGLKTAVYLAEAGQNLKAEEIEVYELSPISELSKEFDDLPKVAYIFQFTSEQFGAMPGYPILYGCSAERLAPTILHPNEILDGAMVTPYRTMGMELYGIQNHPIIKELYRRHGKDLCFMGVVITISHTSEHDNERAAVMASNLVKRVLGADGVILTKSAGGIPELAMAKTAERCEEIGVRTAIALTQYPADMSDQQFDGSVLFNTPELYPIVSMGSPNAAIKLPPVEKIVGRPASLDELPSVKEDIETIFHYLRGVISQIGDSKLISVRH